MAQLQPVLTAQVLPILHRWSIQMPAHASAGIDGMGLANLAFVTSVPPQLLLPMEFATIVQTYKEALEFSQVIKLAVLALIASFGTTD